LDDYLAPNHRARWIRRLVDELDLTELHEAYAGVGSEAYPPNLLIRVVLLELLEGRLSPSQWYRDIRDCLSLRWLSMGIEPSRTAFYAFRDRAGKILESLNAQVIRRARDEGLLDDEVAVLDGTIFRACASRHRLVNSATLERRWADLQQAVQQDVVGENPVESAVPAWMARTAGGRAKQTARYQAAREILQRRLAQNAKREKQDRLAEENVLVSLSDPEAPLGRDKEKVFGPCYNAQFEVEPRSLLVVAYHVVDRVTDAGMLPIMLDRMSEVLGRYPGKQVADAGYVSLLDLQECTRRGTQLIAPLQENDFTAKKRAQKPQAMMGKKMFTWLPEEQTYLCPQGHRLEHHQRHVVTRGAGVRMTQIQYRCPPEHCRACPVHQQCCRNPQRGRTIKRLEGEELFDDQRKLLATPEARRLRKMRGSIIERSFADAKAHRKLRALHGRGLRRAAAEIGLLVLAVNLLRMANLRTSTRKFKPNSS
jgi:transposase